jgi:hypothetical protein
MLHFLGQPEAGTEIAGVATVFYVDRNSAAKRTVLTHMRFA